MDAHMYSYIYDFGIRMIVSTQWGKDEELTNGAEIADYPFTKIYS